MSDKQDGQSPTEWLESEFERQWTNNGMSWKSVAYADSEVMMFSVTPRDSLGRLYPGYYAAGNMISLRVDTELHYRGVRNDAAGPDTNWNGDALREQEELITL